MLRLPIIAHALRGYWWLPTSGGKVLRILNGTYEPEQTSHFMRFVRPGSIVLDVGASAGYYTLLASMLAGDKGFVWAFEPEPNNAAFLRRHLNLNNCRNVHVEEAAVSDSEGRAHFTQGGGTGTGHLDPQGKLLVGTVTLSDFCRLRGINPAVIKIDAEGAEEKVLEGAKDLLARARPVILLSTHGPEIHKRCVRWLRAAGYDVSAILGMSVESTCEILAMPGTNRANSARN